MADITGNHNGIVLWNMMFSSNDSDEAAYFNRLTLAATKYNKVWFVDSVTERLTGDNQVIWCMAWNGTTWEITKFHTPRGAFEVTDRMLKFSTPAVTEISVTDIVEQL